MHRPARSGESIAKITPGLLRAYLSVGTMKKSTKTKSLRGKRRSRGNMLKEYDFSRARPNKHASRYARNTLVVTLDPDVAAMFPGARQVNEALRALAGVMKKHRSRRLSRRSA